MAGSNVLVEVLGVKCSSPKGKTGLEQESGRRDLGIIGIIPPALAIVSEAPGSNKNPDLNEGLGSKFRNPGKVKSSPSHKWVVGHDLSKKEKWPALKVSCAKSDGVKAADEGIVSDAVAVDADVEAKFWVSPSDEMAKWPTGSGPDFHEEGLRSN